MPIRKRRPVKAPNKNFERIMRREQHERQQQGAERLASRYPTVSRIDISMEFVNAQGHILNSEKRSFQPNDAVDLGADCAGRCGNGRMDMEGAISGMINARQTSRQIKGMCRETLFADSNETCNCELRCNVTAQYFPPAES